MYILMTNMYEFLNTHKRGPSWFVISLSCEIHDSCLSFN